jgi:hypothetical protein
LTASLDKKCFQRHAAPSPATRDQLTIQISSLGQGLWRKMLSSPCSSFTCHQGLVKYTDIKHLTVSLEKKMFSSGIVSAVPPVPKYIHTKVHYEMGKHKPSWKLYYRTLRMKVDSDREPKQKQIKKRKGDLNLRMFQ